MRLATFLVCAAALIGGTALGTKPSTNKAKAPGTLAYTAGSLMTGAIAAACIAHSIKENHFCPVTAICLPVNAIATFLLARSGYWSSKEAPTEAKAPAFPLAYLTMAGSLMTGVLAAACIKHGVEERHICPMTIIALPLNAIATFWLARSGYNSFKEASQSKTEESVLKEIR